MEKKIKRLKIFCNFVDIIVGIVLILLGTVGGFSCMGSDDLGQTLVFVLLSFIFIPMFIAFIIFGVVLIFYGLINSIKVARSKEIVTKKAGTITLMVFEIVFSIFSLFFALVFNDYLQIARFVGIAIIVISVILKIIYLVKLNRFKKDNLNQSDKPQNDLPDKTSENDLADTTTN